MIKSLLYNDIDLKDVEVTGVCSSVAPIVARASDVGSETKDKRRKRSQPDDLVDLLNFLDRPVRSQGSSKPCPPQNNYTPPTSDSTFFQQLGLQQSDLQLSAHEISETYCGVLEAAHIDEIQEADNMFSRGLEASFKLNSIKNTKTPWNKRFRTHEQTYKS